MTIKYATYPDNEVVSKYEHATLCQREENYYDDSDGYAHVWDGEKVIKVGTWTTRCHSGHVSTTIDAEGEDIKAWHIAALGRLRTLTMKHAYDDDCAKARKPEKGKRVRVVRGRKVPHGIEGELFWMKEDDYSYNYHTKECDRNRIGIRDDEGNVYWTTDNNVEVVNPVLPDIEDYLGEHEYKESMRDKSLLDIHAAWCYTQSTLPYIR